MADTGILSGIGRTFVDDEPDMKGKLVVFDPEVFKRTKTQLSDLDANRNEWTDVYDKFKNDWAAGQPKAENRAKQETSFLDKFYNGDFASYLSSLRARESDARRAAGDRALDYARGATDRMSLLRGDPGGNSSASRAMALRAGRDVENEIGLADVARERGDFDYINRGQQSALGLRTKLMDAVSTRQLLPHQLNDSELMFAIQALHNIQATRLGAASPVFWRERGDLEKTMDFMDSLAQGAMKGASAATSFAGMGGGMGGMGGGGGGEAPASQNFSFGSPEAAGTGTGEGMPMRAPQQTPSWYDNPNYSPGNDPNFWQKYDGSQTFG